MAKSEKLFKITMDLSTTFMGCGCYEDCRDCLFDRIAALSKENEKLKQNQIAGRCEDCGNVRLKDHNPNKPICCKTKRRIYAGGYCHYWIFREID